MIDPTGHNLPPGSAGRPGPGPVPPVPANREQSAELLVDFLQAQRQVSSLAQDVAEMRGRDARHSQRMSMLQRVAEILAATPKMAQVADVVQEVLVQEFAARTCVVWTLEDTGDSFRPRAGSGLERELWAGLRLPAPNPFPGVPLVLFQNQWLDPPGYGGLLNPLATPRGTALYFIPFENQLLLLGFAILGVEAGRNLEEDQDSLSILQRQVAASLYNAWLVRDLGEQRDALRTQARELEKANAALLEADRFRSEFLALTSHELRTPLTGILGFTRLVLDGLYEDEEEMRQMLADSYASGKHLLELLNDILDLAKIESGRMQMDPAPRSLEPLVEEVKVMVSAYPRAAGVEVAWPGNLGALPEVMVDEGRLKQVLVNLVSNAFKFTPRGSVRILAERGIGVVVLHVADTGIGISREAQAHLFQKFVQAEGGHARGYGGTGLGLVICKHLMEMMHGTIRLESAGEGSGTTITLTVPIA